MTQYELQDFDEALDNAAESLKLAQQLGSVDLIASVLDTTGQIFLAKQDYTQAEGFFRRALALHQGEGNDPDEIRMNLARAVMGQGRLDEVLNSLFQSLESLEARGVKRFTFQVYDLLSTIYEKKATWQKPSNTTNCFMKLNLNFIVRKRGSNLEI